MTSAASLAKILAAGVAFGMVFGVQAHAEDVVVLSSYPEEMTNRYERAFEQANPGIDLKLLWQQGRESMATVRKPDQGGVDVYWAPALSNFPTLAREGAFQPVAVTRADLPGKIGAQTLSDPQGLFEAFEVVGYGIAVNPDVLKQKGLLQPSRWDDLLKPGFSGLVTMPVPSKVGFAPSLYDIILQSKGWAEGWALLSEMAAGAQVAAAGGGPGVIGGVSDGTAAAALTIDFLPRAAAANGKPVVLEYPARTAFLPAHVAMLAKAPHPAAAKAFIAFVLSDAGQKLLFTPEISRYPVRPAVYAQAPKGTINPFALAPDITFPYDPVVGPFQASLIRLTFDAAIASRIEAVRGLWAEIHAAEAAAKTDAARAVIKQARALAGWVPTSAAEAGDLKVLARYETADGKAIQAPDEAKAWAQAFAAKETEARALLKGGKAAK
jgi:phosphoglycerate transport regulatory protein PgtC